MRTSKWSCCIYSTLMSCACCPAEVELQELQRQVDLLSEPGDSRAVGALLQLRRHVLLLQFDCAVRLLVRSVRGNTESCHDGKLTCHS